MSQIERLRRLGAPPFVPGQLWRARGGAVVRIHKIQPEHYGSMYPVIGIFVSGLPDGFHADQGYSWTMDGLWYITGRNVDGQATSLNQPEFDLVELIE